MIPFIVSEISRFDSLSLTQINLKKIGINIFDKRNINSKKSFNILNNMNRNTYFGNNIQNNNLQEIYNNFYDNKQNISNYHNNNSNNNQIFQNKTNNIINNINNNQNNRLFNNNNNQIILNLNNNNMKNIQNNNFFSPFNNIMMNNKFNNNLFNFNNMNQQIFFNPIINNGYQNNFLNNRMNNGISNNWNNMNFNNFHNNNNNAKINKRKRPNSISHYRNKAVNIKKNHSNGIENVGATCYMNATLQCLANIERLTNFLLKDENIQKYSYNNFKYELTNSYTEVLKNLWLNDRITYYSPISFKNKISEMNSLFEGVNANDSKDLVLFLMETMHDELNTAPKKNIQTQMVNQYNYEETLKLFCQFFSNNYQSVISNLFYGMYNSMMACLHCNYITNNIQCYNILIFPLEEVRKYNKINENRVDIIDCFKYYEKIDSMTDKNQIYCNICQANTNAYYASKIIISPNILLINLNRGKGLEFNIKITFQEYLNIRNFVYYNQSPFYYELIGIVTHFGPSSMGGHFIAFCKSFIDHNWYKYNDAQVNFSSFHEASTTGVPYILFYSFIKS